MYYQRQAEYEPKTKARGEDVRNELESVMAGFALLPAPNSKGSGFDSSLVVQPQVINPDEHRLYAPATTVISKAPAQATLSSAYIEVMTLPFKVDPNTIVNFLY